MNKQKMLLEAGLLVLSISAAHAASMMPTNPYGTMFAPWNTMPGGFSPLNNGFTSGGPMGMSPFGSSGSPWGRSTVMPWNAWRSGQGSIMPWGSQMPYGNFSNNGSGMWLPWGGNNSGMGMPWGNNVSPWNSWAGTRNRNNQYYYNNRNRDAWRTMMLMQGLNGQQNLPGLVPMPGMTGVPLLSNTPMMMNPPRMPANTVPVQPQPQNSFSVSPSAKPFNPFSTQAVQSAKPEVPLASAPNSHSAATPSFDPFANDGTVVGQQNQQNGLQFPDADSFFASED